MPLHGGRDMCKTPHEAMRITLPGNIFVVGTSRLRAPWPRRLILPNAARRRLAYAAALLGG